MSHREVSGAWAVAYGILMVLIPLLLGGWLDSL